MLTRDEATAACRGVRNLWPRDESEALRYRRQVVRNPWPPGFGAPDDMRCIRFESGRFVHHYGVGEHGSAALWVVELREQRVPDGYALVEWLAPDGRCADHGDVERHGEQLREIVWHRFSDTNGGWAIGEGPIVMPAERFRGHEGDPWCGEFFVTNARSWIGIPRERLTAEHPDHARHEAELFGPGEGNLIGGVAVYPNHPPRSQR